MSDVKKPDAPVELDKPAKPATIKLKWKGKHPKTFDLPIPFLSYSQQAELKVKKVICDPIGEFPFEDAERLLEIAPDLVERA